VCVCVCVSLSFASLIHSFAHSHPRPPPPSNSHQLTTTTHTHTHIFTEAAALHLDGPNWSTYTTYYRRKLVKDPLGAMALHTMQPAAAGEEEQEAAEAEAEERFATLLRHLQPLKDKGATAAALESPASASRGADNLGKRERGGKRHGNRDGDGGGRGGDVVPEADTAVGRADSEYTAVQAAKALLRPLMLQEAVHQFASAIAARKTLVSHSDLTSPADSYPAARVDRRKVIYHGGPTNSGKTYEALQVRVLAQ
jgi:hypothetical protein